MVKTGELIIYNNDVWEVVAIDFGAVCYLQRYYNNGEVDLFELDIDSVEKCIKEMKERGLDWKSLA